MLRRSGGSRRRNRYTRPARRRYVARRRFVRRGIRAAQAETKYHYGALFDTFTDITSAGTQVIDVVAGIPTGDDVVSHRDGRQIFVKNLYVHGFLHVDDEDADVRICVYACLTSFSSALLMTDILTPLRKNNLYKVYKNRLFRLTTDDVHGVIPIKWKIRINRRFTYQSAAVSTNNVALRIHAVSDRGAAHGPTFQGGNWMVTYRG